MRSSTPGGGAGGGGSTLGLSGWGCATGTLKPQADHPLLVGAVVD